MAAIAEKRRETGDSSPGTCDFPFLVLEGARSRGNEMAVIAIPREASPASRAPRGASHWIQPRRTRPRHRSAAPGGMTQAVMAGQVKHNKICSSIGRIGVSRSFYFRSEEKIPIR